jgi:hypothetical protein
MRKSILIICSCVLLFCAWLLFQYRPAAHKEAIVIDEPAPVASNQEATNKQAPLPKPDNAGPGTASLPPTPTSQTVQPTNDDIYQQVLPEWQVPIDFYGKVIDENSNPVAGASVQFNWTESPMEALNEGPGETAATTSDASGLFELHDKHGPSLNVSVGKDGYYSSRNNAWTFSYALNGHFSADPANPVIFHLRKKGVGEKLISVKQNYRIPRDGTPVGIDLITGKVTPGGIGNLVVQCWTDDAGKSSGQKYDWHCLVTIPGGGLVLSDEEFLFQAPENGYVPSTEIKMPADRPDWRNDVDLKFFYLLPNGNYGRMTFSMIAGGQHFCMIDSVLNPSGSRDLEPAQ